MEVAILNPEYEHSEVIGTFLEVFSALKCKIILFSHNQGHRRWEAFYQKYIPKKVFERRSPNHFVSQANRFKCIVSITGSGSERAYISQLSQTIKDKMLYVIHIKGHVQGYMKHKVVLSPYVRDDTKITDIYPIYKIPRWPAYTCNKRINFVTVGSNRCGKKLADFTKMGHRNSKFRFNMILSGKYADSHFVRNVKQIGGPNTIQMMEIMKKSHFVVPLLNEKGWHVGTHQHGVRLSGTLPLAMICQRPMIIQKHINDKYYLKGNITFNKSITEVEKRLQKMTNEEYKKLVKEVKNQLKARIQRNTKIIKSLMF